MTDRCRAKICPWFHVATRDKDGKCRSCGGRPEPRPSPGTDEIGSLRPGTHFVLYRDTKGRKGWIFEVGDTLCGREHSAFLVSGGKYPSELPGDEFWFRKTRRVVQVVPLSGSEIPSHLLSHGTKAQE